MKLNHILSIIIIYFLAMIVFLTMYKDIDASLCTITF